MRCYDFACVVVTLLAGASYASAGAVTINFNTLADGVTPSPVTVPRTEILDQYASLGVSFANSDPLDTSTTPTWHQNLSVPTPYAFDGIRTGNFGFDVRADFGFGGVTEVSADLVTAANRSITLTAYDAGGAVLGAQTLGGQGTLSGIKGRASLSGFSQPISYVIASSSEPTIDAAGIDNLSFTPVPYRITDQFAGADQFQLDIDGAVGPQHFAEISNLEFRVYGRSNGQVVSVEPLGGIGGFWTRVFGNTSYGFAFDPRLQYDHDTQRWFAISSTNPGAPNGEVLIGVSATSDPTGAWNGLRVPSDPAGGYWTDFPRLGIDKDGFFVSAFGIPDGTGGPLKYELWSIPKLDLVGTPPTFNRLTRLQLPAGSHQPQLDPTGSSNDGKLVMEFPNEITFLPDCRLSSGDRTFHEVGGSGGGSPTLLGPTIASRTTDLGLDECIAPDLAGGGRQPGTTQVLTVQRGDNLYRVGDHLYFVMSGLRYLGALGIYWEKIDAVNNQIVDHGFLGHPDYDLLVPGIAANEHGDVVIAYTRSGPNEFASAYASVGKVTELGKLEFNDPILLKAGIDIYDRSRWNDYSTSVTTDPDDSRRFWIMNAYFSALNTASTWITEITFAPTFPPSCDFTSDGMCNIDDIDSLIMAIATSTHDPRLDLNGDGVIDLADRDEWLTAAGALNLVSGNPYLVADFDLDGIVDGLDFIIWNMNKFSETGKWSLGDADANGLTDGLDFILWNANKYTSSDGLSVVPEPATGIISLIAMLLLGAAIQRHSRQVSGSANLRFVLFP